MIAIGTRRVLVVLTAFAALLLCGAGALIRPAAADALKAVAWNITMLGLLYVGGAQVLKGFLGRPDA